MPEQETTRQEFVIPSLDGGWVPDVSPQLLDPTEGRCETFKNVWPRQGILGRRPGVEKFLESVGGGIWGLHHFVKLSEGKSWYLLVSEGVLYKWDQEEKQWDKTKVVDLPKEETHRFRTFADRAILANGENSLMSWGEEKDMTYQGLFWMYGDELTYDELEGILSE